MTRFDHLIRSLDRAKTRRGFVRMIGGVTAGSLLLGGALGNLVDRAATGAVHDFLVVGPVVINVADVAVLAGVLAVWRGLARSPIGTSSHSAAREAQRVEGR